MPYGKLGQPILWSPRRLPHSISLQPVQIVGCTGEPGMQPTTAHASSSTPEQGPHTQTTAVTHAPGVHRMTLHAWSITGRLALSHLSKIPQHWNSREAPPRASHMLHAMEYPRAADPGKPQVGPMSGHPQGWAAWDALAKGKTLGSVMPAHTGDGAAL